MVSFLRSVTMATSRCQRKCSCRSARRQIFRDLHRDAGEEIIGLGQFAVCAGDDGLLPALQHDEGDADQLQAGNTAADI